MIGVGGCSGIGSSICWLWGLWESAYGLEAGMDERSVPVFSLWGFGNRDDQNPSWKRDMAGHVIRGVDADFTRAWMFMYLGGFQCDDSDPIRIFVPNGEYQNC
jgi:hypothetical protein